jgi:hypothetical protein
VICISICNAMEGYCIHSRVEADEVICTMSKSFSSSRQCDGGKAISHSNNALQERKRILSFNIRMGNLKNRRRGRTVRRYSWEKQGVDVLRRTSSSGQVKLPTVNERISVRLFARLFDFYDGNFGSSKLSASRQRRTCIRERQWDSDSW